MSKKSDSKTYIETVWGYQAIKPQYERLVRYLKSWLATTASELGIYPIVMGRAKSIESFAEKICRPGKSYDDPLDEMTDLCGVRVITHTLDEVNVLAELVRREFIVDALNSEDKQMHLAYREFGYLSQHFILQLKEPPIIDGLTTNECHELTELKFELQLRTMAQHMWADNYHELGYKNEFKLPGRWEREFARLAALLESCDQTFQNIKNAMGTYETTYNAYMTQEELQELAEQLEMLLEVDSENVNAMHRLIKTYLALDNSASKLLEVLNKYQDKLQFHAPALRDMGVALCQIYPPESKEFLKGLGYLEKAVDIDPRDIDALCSLGGVYRRQGKADKAIDHYRRAHHLDPTNPYPLGNYVAVDLVHKGDIDIVQYFRSHIQAAADRCLKQIEVDVNLPWAFFDLGIFYLYLGDPNTSIAYYAKGIDSASNDWMIHSANKTITSFIQKGIPLAGVELINKLLKNGWWTKASKEERKQSDWQPKAKNKISASNILIMAGGCANMGDVYQQQLVMLQKTLASYSGTIISGGIQSGIPKLVGNLQAENNSGQLKTIGYLPDKKMSGIGGRIDNRYCEHRHTNGEDFSALEPLSFWENYLASGGDPGKVKLIGFNGGDIAAAEYRIALAYGGQVGIIQDSGRAADEILDDPLWRQRPGLQVLALTNECISKFLSE